MVHASLDAEDNALAARSCDLETVLSIRVAIIHH
jgi:hypothetical protein